MIAFATAAKRTAVVLVVTAAVAACSTTEEIDRVAVGAVAPGQAALRAAAAGTTLLVLDSGLRADTPERPERIAEAKAVVRRTVAERGVAAVEPEGPLGAEPADGWTALGEERLLAAARQAGLRSMLLVRVEDYTNLLRIGIPLPLPLPLLQTESAVGVRLKLVRVADGTVLVDAYRNRTRGGFFAVRTRADLPDELGELVRSLVEA